MKGATGRYPSLRECASVCHPCIIDDLNNIHSRQSLFLELDITDLRNIIKQAKELITWWHYLSGEYYLDACLATPLTSYGCTHLDIYRALFDRLPRGINPLHSNAVSIQEISNPTSLSTSYNDKHGMMHPITPQKQTKWELPCVISAT